MHFLTIGLRTPLDAHASDVKWLLNWATKFRIVTDSHRKSRGGGKGALDEGRKGVWINSSMNSPCSKQISSEVTMH